MVTGIWRELGGQRGLPTRKGLPQMLSLREGVRITGAKGLQGQGCPHLQGGAAGVCTHGPRPRQNELLSPLHGQHPPLMLFQWDRADLMGVHLYASLPYTINFLKSRNTSYSALCRCRLNDQTSKQIYFMLRLSTQAMKSHCLHSTSKWVKVSKFKH